MSLGTEREPWKSVESGNLALVQAIKRRPCLYNNTLPEYTQKNVTQAAWQEIADEFGCSVVKCKKRWKGLRTVFVREKIAQCNNKKKNPYYLDKHMSFVLPFTHSRLLLKKLASVCPEINYDSTEIMFDESVNLNETHEAIRSVAGVNSEADDTMDGKIVDALNAEDTCDKTLTSEKKVRTVKPRIIQHISSFQTSISENFQSSLGNSSNNYFERQPNCSKDLHDVSFSDTENPRRQFMMSLLPELFEMSESNFRIFKRKVLQLIDDIRLVS